MRGRSFSFQISVTIKSYISSLTLSEAFYLVEGGETLHNELVAAHHGVDVRLDVELADRVVLLQPLRAAVLSNVEVLQGLDRALALVKAHHVFQELSLGFCLVMDALLFFRSSMRLLTFAC